MGEGCLVKLLAPQSEAFLSLAYVGDQPVAMLPPMHPNIKSVNCQPSHIFTAYSLFTLGRGILGETLTQYEEKFYHLPILVNLYLQE